MLKHGDSKTRLYSIWRSMLKRCYYKKDCGFKNYGARGITVCDEWKNDYISFKNWSIENGYRDNLSIDRINNDGNYEPSNCRWVTQLEQARNKRRTISITYNGKTQTLVEWSEELNISYYSLVSRLKHHKWSVEQAFETPIGSKTFNVGKPITYQNKTQPLSQWSRELNINYNTLRVRLQRCRWSVEKAFTTPIKKR